MQRAINFHRVDGIYVFEILVAPKRAGSAGSAVGVAGETFEQPESSGVPGGAPSDRERRAAQRKGVLRG
eukprot:11256700-Alexandrium_andersonii.AAC.1